MTDSLALELLNVEDEILSLPEMTDLLDLLNVEVDRILSRISNIHLAEKALVILPEIADLILNKFPELKPVEKGD